MLRPVPLFGIGTLGKSANVNAQERLNLYIEIQSDPEKSTLTMYPTPGLVSFVYFGATAIRGCFEARGVAYIAWSGTLYSLLNDGTTANLGTLSTLSGRVDFAENGTQIMLVDGANGYIYNTSTLAFNKKIGRAHV